MTQLGPAPIHSLASAELSVAREKILEHQLVSQLAVLMLQRGVELDVLRSEFDANGHDVVLEAAGIVRHLQLKASVECGARRAVNVNVRLRSKPSGCIIWMSYDPVTLEVTRYHWFGGEPGDPLPALGERFARHTKANALGEKSLRVGQRLVPKTKFDVLDRLDEVADRLFGPIRTRATHLALSQLRQRYGSRWREALEETLVPVTVGTAARIASLVDGHAILELLCVQDEASWRQRLMADCQTGEWPEDIGLLWVLLSLECPPVGLSDVTDLANKQQWRDEAAANLIARITAEVLP